MQSYLGVGETFNFQEIETKGEKEFYITGYISTKSIDKFNDVITDECLDDMLVQVKSGSIKIDFEHETIHNDNLNINPVARIVDAKKDNKGLWVKALVNSSHKRFSEIKGSIVKGFLDSFSIAFKPIETATRYIQGKAVRILNKLKLINVGITGTPVNDECKLDKVMVKALMEFDIEDEEIDEDEEFVDLDELSDAEIKAHKYIKRTGSAGNYKYFYRDGSTKTESRSKLENEKNAIDAVMEFLDDQPWKESEKEEYYKIAEKIYDKKELTEDEKNKLADIYKKIPEETLEKYSKLKGEMDKHGEEAESEKRKAKENEKNEEEMDKLSIEEDRKGKEKPKEREEGNPYKKGSQAYADFEKAQENQDKMKNAKTDKDILIAYLEGNYGNMDEVVKDNYGKKLSELDVEGLKKVLEDQRDDFNLEEWKKKNKLEKKALTTQSGLAIGNINHTSQSSSKEGDNRQMENETKPVEQATETEAIAEPAKVEAVEEVKEVENTEVKELKEELAEVKAQLVKVQKQLAQPEMKAIQEAMPTTKLKDNVTPLGLIG